MTKNKIINSLKKDGADILSASLILDSLSGFDEKENLGNIKELATKDLEKIKEKNARFLLSRKNKKWVFSPQNMAENFLALSSLAKYSSEILNGHAVAQILLLLAGLEKKEGGPYFSGPKDKKIDLGVNAAIGYFLSSQEVSLPEINKIAESAIKAKNFSSNYLKNKYLVVYLISGFYAGSQKENLIKYILGELAELKEKKLNILDLALLICSLSRLGYSLLEIKKFAGWFEKETANISFLSSLEAALYLRIIEKTKFLSQKDGKEKKEREEEDKALAQIIKFAQKRFSSLEGSIRDFALREIKRTIKVNGDRQMSLMAYFTKKALGKKASSVSDSLIYQMGLINTFFWTGFIIYDDFWDEDERRNPQILPTANFYTREFVLFFKNLFPQDKNWEKFFSKLMDKLDAANTWETVFCRLKKDGAQVSVPDRLPDYRNYEKKYEPASGHILGPIAIFKMLGYGEKSAETKNFIDYFKNYLIAMQLNDDAHDWEEDLRRGHISTATVILLQDYLKKYPQKKKIDIDKELEDLQKIFWFKTLPKICEITFKYAKKSREALRKVKIIENPKYLEKMINLPEKAMKDAEREYKMSVEFLNEYSNK